MSNNNLDNSRLGSVHKYVATLFVIIGYYILSTLYYYDIVFVCAYYAFALIRSYQCTFALARQYHKLSTRDFVQKPLFVVFMIFIVLTGFFDRHILHAVDSVISLSLSAIAIINIILASGTVLFFWIVDSEFARMASLNTGNVAHNVATNVGYDNSTATNVDALDDNATKSVDSNVVGIVNNVVGDRDVATNADSVGAIDDYVDGSAVTGNNRADSDITNVGNNAVNNNIADNADNENVSKAAIVDNDIDNIGHSLDSSGAINAPNNKVLDKSVASDRQFLTGLQGLVTNMQLGVAMLVAVWLVTFFVGVANIGWFFVLLPIVCISVYNTINYIFGLIKYYSRLEQSIPKLHIARLIVDTACFVACGVLCFVFSIGLAGSGSADSGTFDVPLIPLALIIACIVVPMTTCTRIQKLLRTTLNANKKNRNSEFVNNSQ